MEPSKQYRIWQFIAAAVRPVSYVDIAVGMGMSESTVRRVVWNLANRDKAVRNIRGSKRVGRSDPTWVAVPNVAPRRAGRSRTDQDRPAEVRRIERGSDQRTELPDWPPCELARIYGLVARQRDSGGAQMRAGGRRNGAVAA